MESLFASLAFQYRPEFSFYVHHCIHYFRLFAFCKKRCQCIIRLLSVRTIFDFESVWCERGITVWRMLQLAMTADWLVGCQT